MYRSSKLNEERVNTLRTNEELFQYYNDKMNGKDSITNYLPTEFFIQVQ